MESLKRTAGLKGLALGGLILMALGGLVYSLSLTYDHWGLAGSGAGLVLILIAAALGRGRLADLWQRRSTRLGLGAGVAVLAVVALTVFLGALAGRHNLRWDLTMEGKHSLAPQSKSVLKDLKTPVKAYAFYQKSNPLIAQAQELLDRYAHLTRKFTFEMVDPDINPLLAKRFALRNLAQGALVLVSGDREEQVQGLEEQALTNALVRLTRQGQKIIYFLQGHGEKQLDDAGKEGYSSLKRELEQSGYKIKPLILATAKEVPTDAAALVVAGPRKELLEPEEKRLGKYLSDGGGVLVLLEPDSGRTMYKWLLERGIRLAEDIVFDRASQLFQASPAWPLAYQYGDHPITRPLKGIFCFFPLARSVELINPLPSGLSGLVLVKSSPQSWAETDFEGLRRGEAEFNQGADRQGPIGLAAVITLGRKPGAKETGDKPAPRGRLVVFGDSDFANNTSLSHGGNRDLMLNSLGYLAQEEDLISIRAKQEGNQPLMPTPIQESVLFWVVRVIMPLFAMILGIVVVYKRRRPA